jgi:hypothetical protein
MSTAREALLRDVRRMREANRGDVLRYRVSYRCTTPDCGAEVITIHVLEESERKKFQPPNYCPRCRTELLDYVGFQLGW